MTLTSLLEIKASFLQPLEHRSLDFAEREWLRLGAPSEPVPLCDAIEEILKRSVEEGVGYPRVLLLKKKQLQRGTWKPRARPILAMAAEAINTPRRAEEEIIAEARRTYSPEQFERFMTIRKEGQAYVCTRPTVSESGARS